MQRRKEPEDLIATYVPQKQEVLPSEPIDEASLILQALPCVATYLWQHFRNAASPLISPSTTTEKN